MIGCADMSTATPLCYKGPLARRPAAAAKKHRLRPRSLAYGRRGKRGRKFGQGEGAARCLLSVVMPERARDPSSGDAAGLPDAAN
jgi:hypothetical protein